MRTIGVVMAGGNSTRFGEDKAFYPLDGRPMYRHVMAALDASGVCDEVVVSTNERLEQCFRAPVIVDDRDYRDHGPLGGLYQLAANYPGDRLLVVSCDAPHVSPEWLRILDRHAKCHEDAIILTKEDGRRHPLIAVYQGEDLAGMIEEQLASGRLSMRALFEKRETVEVDVGLHGISRDTLMNINRKTDIR